MIAIHQQQAFKLEEETKDIVLVNNTKNTLVQAINNTVDGFIKKELTEPFSTVLPLGKLSSKKLHIINKNDFDNYEKREKIYQRIASIKEDICVLIDTFEETNSSEIVQEFSEKMITLSYQFDRFKSSKKEQEKAVYFYSEKEIQQQVFKGSVYGEMINKCRDLVNTPYNYLNAIDLSEYAKRLERYDGITVDIYNRKQIEGMNMGSFLGVNMGSSEEPRLIHIKYQGEQDFTQPTALVGKGVMYDTGGYSLKTGSSMPGMKSDMAGAAAVISAIEAIAKLKLKTNVMSIVAATDNRIGDGAIVPDDILTAANGKTIEIISTDAEGRLTLADAVWFAQQQGARKVIDIATLTGSMVRSLGMEYTGAFTNNKTLLKTLMSASEKVHENLWEMPLNRGYHKLIESKVADIKNTGGPLAGASTAAAFIENFINKDTEWVHLDIAGTSVDDKKQATGVMVKTFTELFCK